MFQSSPVLWDGRYAEHLSMHPNKPVSILARPVGRALLWMVFTKSLISGFQSSPVLWDGRYITWLYRGWHYTRFNPRPSCGTGATWLQVVQLVVFVVSILARPVGRALRILCALIFAVTWFQSSPVLWDGRYAPIARFFKLVT